MSQPLMADQRPFGVGLLTEVVPTPVQMGSTQPSTYITSKQVPTLEGGVLHRDEGFDSSPDVHND